MTEVRLGAIVGLYELDDATVPEGLYAAKEGTTRVEITVNQDATDISAVIKDANEIEQACTVSDSTITAELPVGVYTFEITTSDPRYTGKITGSFTVESSIQIVTPQLPTNGMALEAFTIPQAQIKENGELTEKTATCMAVFKPTYNSDGTPGTETPVSSTFTPSSSGTLTITYTYDGALEKVFTVTIGRAAKPENVLLDLRSNDVLADVKTNEGGCTITYDEENQYLVWESAVGSNSAWRQLYVNFRTTQDSLKGQGIKFVAMDVYYKTTAQSTKDVVGWLCGQQFKVGETSETQRIPCNAWYTIYIPIEYMTNNVLNGTSDLMQIIFEYNNNRFNYIEAVYLKGFELVKEAETTITFYDPAQDGTDNVKVEQAGGKLSVATDETGKAYLSWVGVGGWDKLVIANHYPNYNAFDVYEYVAVEVFYNAPNSTKVVSGYFAGADYTIGSNNTADDIGLAVNQWVTVYIPIDTFYSSGAVKGNAVGDYLISCGFTNGGHFPGVTEVRIGNIYFTNENA